MRNNMMKRFAALAAAMLMLLPSAALANTGGKEDTDTEPAVIVETSATPTPTPPVIDTDAVIEVTNVPFSIPGNGEVLDDITDSSKEFYIITTANNNTFYLVVDKASSSQNVYMLSKVDENDLAEFIEGGSTGAVSTPAPQPTLLIQPTPAPTAAVIETQPVEAESAAGSYTAIIVIAVAAVGALIYFKVVKPKKQINDDDSEGMEFDDSEDEHEDE